MNASNLHNRGHGHKFDIHHFFEELNGLFHRPWFWAVIAALAILTAIIVTAAMSNGSGSQGPLMYNPPFPYVY